MEILILMPTEEGKHLMKDAISKTKTKHSYKVVQCGIGKVESAVTTAMELSRKEYDAVVLSGFCGAANNHSKSNVAIPSICQCYDFFNSNFNEEIDTDFPTLFGDGSVMMTGDQFANGNTIRLIRQRHESAELYFDMESSAVCQACIPFGMTPLIVKLVADYPEEGDTLDTFREFVKKTDFSSVVGFIEDYFTEDEI